MINNTYTFSKLCKAGLKLVFGFLFSCVLLLPSSAQTNKVKQAEYFWDIDPGNGNGIVLGAADGNFDNAIEELFKSNPAFPGTGTHRFSIRVIDDSNTWSPLFTTAVTIANGVVVSRNTKIKQAEYFWDTDPGVGNGFALLALDGNFDNALEELFKSGITALNVGVHSFNVRVKDENNVWSPRYTTIVSVENGTLITRNIKVKQGEFFWDIDPGVGNGSTLLALDGSFDNTIEHLFKNGIPVPAAGYHTFNVRIKEESNFWSPLFTQSISVENGVLNKRITKVKQGEYFWDADPGIGNGTSVLALDGNFDNTLEEIVRTNSPFTAVGVHKLNIRVKDENNIWSPLFTTIISVTKDVISKLNARIKQAEYFWDADPGPGNGTLLLAADGNFDDVLEDVFKTGISTTGLTVGAHTFFIRVKDLSEKWGPVYANSVDVWDPNSVYNIKNSISDLLLSPNPGEGYYSIQFSTLIQNEMIINIYNTVGELIKSEKIATQKGNNTHLINLKDNAKGIYTIVVKTESQHSVLKLVNN